jgi:hypothetical protein
MARIQLHGMFYDVRNKVGNLVYSKWRTINYVRQLVIPLNPNTLLQQDQRNSMARLVDFWQFFQTSTKAAWNYVATDQGYSGYNRWIGVNIALEKTQAPLELSPTTDVDFLTAFTASPGAANQISITFAASPVPAGHSLSVYVQKPRLDTDKTSLVEYTTLPAGTASPQVISSLFGTGTNVNVYGMLVNTTLNRSGSSRTDPSLIG